MRRNTKDNIQVSYPLADENKDNSNYDLLIPKYEPIKHNGIYDTVSANEGTFTVDTYDRDNYNIIPYKVPPMMFTGTSYPLDWKILYDTIPTISRARGVDYDRNIWLTDKGSQDTASNLWVTLPGDGTYNTFSSIVLASYSSFKSILNASLDPCESKVASSDCGRTTGYPDYKNYPDTYQCGPLDKVDTGYLGIADAFAYAWSENWDMSLVNRSVKYGNTISIRDDSSSSSSSSSAPGSNIRVCKIVRVIEASNTGVITAELQPVMYDPVTGYVPIGPVFVASLPTSY